MPTPVTDPDLLAQLNAPARPEVASSKRVWGDQEAEAAGLYETPKQITGKPVTDPNILRLLNGPAPQAGPTVSVRPFRERFQEPPQPENASALESGLRSRGIAQTRGPEMPVGSQLLTDFQNQGAAAGQGTTPNIRAQMANLISDQVYEGDSGFASYKDPATGQIVEADQNKHVILRDPVDGRLKVFGRTSDTDEGRLSAAGRLLGTGLGAGAATRRPSIPVPSQPQVRASDILSTSKPYYRAFDAAEEVSVGQSADVIARIKGAMESARVPEHLAEEVYKSLDKALGRPNQTVPHLQRLEAEMNWRSAAPPPQAPVTLGEMKSAKELVGQSSRSIDSRVRQGAGAANREIGDIVRETSPAAAQNLRTADDIYSTARSVQDLQRAEAIAGLRAGRAGYGGNAVNSMRQVLSPIVEKSIKGQTTGYRPNEIAAMREIVEGTTLTNTLRGIGQLSPSKGAIQTGLSFSTVGLTGVVGAVANKLAAVVTGQQIERLKELVAKRSPAYEQAVQKALDRYEKAQMDLVNKPGSNTLAGFVAASRQLSNGLTRDGIQVTSGDLMRAIQGPVKGRAEDEQPKPERVVN